jgi:hypothetical protein
MQRTPSLRLANCESHPQRGATRVVEFRIPDPLSARHDEYLERRYLLVCADDDCDISAHAAARMSGAHERTIATYPLTVADFEAITGLQAA